MVANKFAFSNAPARFGWRAPALAVASGFALMHGVVMALHMRKAVAFGRSIEPLQAEPPNSTARLLLVGDSTAVGTGASTADASVAGLIARHHPDVHIVNRARVGAKFADIVRQLEPLGPPGPLERFDIILILGGGNEVVRLTSSAALQASVGRALQLASAKAIYVNCYKEKLEDPFVREAGRLSCADGLHPSDEGYLLWFGALQNQAALSRRLVAVAGQ